MNTPSFMNKIQLTQCYHCFDWCHKRNACPNISDPVTCSHCAGSGHNYLECRLPLLCNNCEGSHAATYRGCPSHQIALNKVMDEFQMHFNQNNSTFNSSSQDHDILRAARLASKNPTEFAEQLFNATSTLINPPNSPSPSLAFDCELDLSIDDTDEQEQASAIPPQTETSVAAIPAPQTNTPLVRQGYIIDNAIIIEQELKLKHDSLFTNEGPKPYNKDTYNDPKPGYLEITYNFDQTADAWIGMLLDEEAGIMTLQGHNFKPDIPGHIGFSGNSQKFRAYLDLAQINPPIIKQNILSIQCPFTNQIYNIKYFKNWDFTKGPPTKNAMKKSRDNSSPKEIEKWMNSLIAKFKSKRSDPIIGLNYWRPN